MEDKLKSIVQETFQEILWEADVVLRSHRDKNITKVTDNLRGVCGITVVPVAGPAKSVSSTAERTILKVKFFKVHPGSIKQHLARMSNDARRIDGVFSFIPIRWNKVVSRIYRPKA